MSVVPICYKVPCKDHSLVSQNALIRQQERDFARECSLFSLQSNPFISIAGDELKRRQSSYILTENLMKMKKRCGVNHASKGENFGVSSSSAIKKQLRSLDSYFGKLERDINEPSSISSNETSELPDKIHQLNSKEELESLNAYLRKLNRDLFAANVDSRTRNEKKLEGFVDPRTENADIGSRRPRASQQNDETSDLYLINTLASLNIAVFLFEIASPVRNSEFELFSLPLLYGAKINDLILVGEWWRLLTPMFLHSGIFHVALGCWSLITFGPQVCRGYGSFTFFLIYILGGISGNLTSFLHTPEPTVGGTGPIFSIIGAWLIYQVQHKDVIAKDVSDSLFQKAIITTSLSFILSHFGPIDDWTHLGAVITGIIYGFFACPTLQLDDTSPRSGRDEGIAIVGRHADPCKSLIIFTLFLIFLSTLLFFIEPPLEALVPEELEQFV